jgi:hypothetical protein
MTGTSVAAYGRVRAAVMACDEPVRALCAKEGVSWQALYRHARRQGWVLRQPRQRRPGLDSVLERLEEALQAHVADVPRTRREEGRTPAARKGISPARLPERGK